MCLGVFTTLVVATNPLTHYSTFTTLSCTALISADAKGDTHMCSTLGPLLRSRLKERLGETGSALDLAMRILACDSMNIDYNRDRETLLRLQC